MHIGTYRMFPRTTVWSTDSCFFIEFSTFDVSFLKNVFCSRFNSLWKNFLKHFSLKSRALEFSNVLSLQKLNKSSSLFKNYDFNNTEFTILLRNPWCRIRYSKTDEKSEATLDENMAENTLFSNTIHCQNCPLSHHKPNVQILTLVWIA